MHSVIQPYIVHFLNQQYKPDTLKTWGTDSVIQQRKQHFLQTAKISVNNYLIVVNREAIFLHRICIMLINDFQQQQNPCLRCLVFMKKLLCTYGLNKSKKGSSNQ